MKSGRFSIVIPNWNGRRFLKACLDSLLLQSYDDIEIIVVDNASTDGSQDFVAERYAEVTLLPLEQNRGFTGACNAGMEAATGEFIALLNNDTEVEGNWVQAIESAFRRHPDVGMIASKMLLFDRRDTFHTAGDFFSIDGRAMNRGAWQVDRGQYDREEYVFGACGGSAAYRKSMLDQIGSLDDDYFFLLEDVDLAWRAQLAGYRALYVPSAVVYHHLSATGGGVTASFHDGRNGIWLLVKNVPGGLLRKHGAAIVRRQLQLALEALLAWRGAEARARLRGMLAGAVGIRGAFKKRRIVQATKIVSDDYLDEILSHPSQLLN